MKSNPTETLFENTLRRVASDEYLFLALDSLARSGTLSGGGKTKPQTADEAEAQPLAVAASDE